MTKQPRRNNLLNIFHAHLLSLFCLKRRLLSSALCNFTLGGTLFFFFLLGVVLFFFLTAGSTAPLSTFPIFRFPVASHVLRLVRSCLLLSSAALECCILIKVATWLIVYQITCALSDRGGTARIAELSALGDSYSALAHIYGTSRALISGLR